MKSVREQAINLRKKGWSYNIISERLGVAKSTLSDWLRSVPYTPNQAVIDRIKAGPAKSAENRQKAIISEIQLHEKNALSEVGEISDRDLWFLGIGLYLGEGSKLYETTRFINSDPKIIQLMMKWFRDVCHIPNKNFSIAVHLYPDVSESYAIQYWSRITGVPKNQFEKIQVDRRPNKSAKKRRQLPYGTAHVKVLSRGDKQFGVSFHRKMMGWFEAVYTNAGVV